MPKPKTVATFLDKGGVGKTTTTAHLGVALAQKGKDVLLIDLGGKQNDLAKQFGLYEEVVDADDWPNISTIFSDDWSSIADKIPDAVNEMIHDTDEGVDLIPAHEGLDQVDDDLASTPLESRFDRLESFLIEDLADADYDIVLLDLPGLTNNVTLNGLYAAQKVVVPITPGAFELRQLAVLQEDLREMHEFLDREVEIALIVPNEIETHTTLGRETIDVLEAEYTTLLAPENVPKSQDISNAQNEGKTIYALESPSSTARRARDAFDADADALLSRI